jgi:hypothetical protein
MRVGVIIAQNCRTFYSYLPHPAPLPPGEREFLDENQAKKKELSNTS